jgi:hypothetical protein
MNRTSKRFKGGQIIVAKAISPGACVIDPASRIDVETLVREFVPEEILPALHRAIVHRLGECPMVPAAGDLGDRSTEGNRSTREAEEKGALPPLRSPF